MKAKVRIKLRNGTHARNLDRRVRALGTRGEEEYEGDGSIRSFVSWAGQGRAGEEGPVRLRPSSIGRSVLFLASDLGVYDARCTGILSTCSK